jgi:hypothetical protein
MNRSLLTALIGLAIGYGAGAQAASGPPGPPAGSRVAVVVDATAPPAVVGAAIAGARAAGVPYRAPRSTHEQLAVTSRLALEGYGSVVGVGLEDRYAIRPLHGRVRHLAIAEAPAAGLAGRVAARARAARSR